MARIDRRDLLIGSAIAGFGLGTGCGDDGRPAQPGPAQPGPAQPAPIADAGAPVWNNDASDAERPLPPMPTRPLGKTGKQVTILGLGGLGPHAHAGSRDLGLDVIDKAFERGVRFFDTAPTYDAGEAILGEGLVGRRDQVMVATKCNVRFRDLALRQIEASLVALRTDHIDLLQVHDIRRQSDIDAVMGPDGAMMAFQEMLDQKVVKHLGVSGHAYPEPLINFLELVPFDTILLAINPAESFVRPFKSTVLPVAVAKGMGIILMKTCANGVLMSQITPREALSYGLSLPVATAIVGVQTVAQVVENTATARTFVALSDEEMLDIEQRAASVGHDATFFRRGVYAD